MIAWTDTDPANARIAELEALVKTQQVVIDRLSALALSQRTQIEAHQAEWRRLIDALGTAHRALTQLRGFAASPADVEADKRYGAIQ